MKNLLTKNAFVTGGSRGIGAAIVTELAQQGAAVTFTYQNASDKAQTLVDAITQNGGRVLAIKADSANPAAVINAINQAAETFGKVDILVNNAAVAYFNNISAFTIEEFDHTMAVNVRAVFSAVQAVLLHMPNGGRIITIGSCLATRVTGSGWGLYSMSKAALIGFTKAVARDLGSKEITVNIVHPGPIDTDMNPANGEHAEHQRANMAIPKFGEGEDIAGIVTYLAGPHGKYITGAGFDVDGGTNA
ncbi:MAG: 3-oxoacyl-ACP reductase family protein [Chryseolinea sp.]